MTQKIEVNPDTWTLLSAGKTRGIVENESGSNVKIRIEAAGSAAPSDAESWGHNLPVLEYFTWEKSSTGADIYAKTTSGVGELIVTEG
ncbi:hypothetical protein [Vibrio hepatarius]|uniref:hypothetical protein n=1 Tax=Vibrio hepatarius TaxID=171383 RepID=UPI00148C18C9|nr:hypothetical protein [Vibrio hepatarius]NOI14830.1 hypothetical protein [Vibrio hepatarius]